MHRGGWRLQTCALVRPRSRPYFSQYERSLRPASAGFSLAIHPREFPVSHLVRIAVDVSPLSHPRTGIGTYLRGSLTGLAAAAAGEHEILAFAPTSPRGLSAIPAALKGVPVDLRLRFLPLAHFWRQGWSRLGRPGVERFLGPVDVLHFSDWMYPPQRGGVRATTIHDLVPLRFPHWVQGRTRTAAVPQASSSDRCDEQTTGAPHAIASITGSPNPSKSEE